MDTWLSIKTSLDALSGTHLSVGVSMKDNDIEHEQSQQLL